MAHHAPTPSSKSVAEPQPLITIESCRQHLVDDATGAPRYTPHQLRHTRGTELLAQGQRVEIVQRVLGHRDIRSTLGLTPTGGEVR